ncbi:MAG: type II toxin-antitoxin system RelE/ParE family toxin [Chamaesiphon sp.]|nr:type II toxin-antitoxin system RelE/ParE family toxin [Chamaesiphon sp.]
MTTHNDGKETVWLSSEIKTPPFSQSARIEAGSLLKQLQDGELLSMPVSSIGKHCYELRVGDSENNQEWRIIYQIDDDAIIIAGVFSRKLERHLNR